MQRWTSLVHSAKHQIYMSRVQDPYLNLSIEHYLLQNSSPSSTILFLYINSPCVVIGRNQNPWLEANLKLLEQSRISLTLRAKLNGLHGVELVRRRSGGGAVFHDEGNVNYSVICPPAAFTRDKHAEMVTKAIRTFNDRARVNERHDIVLDGGALLPPMEVPPVSDMHRTKYSQPHQSLKVSGSAYKIVRNRCLHHGTCLILSPNLLTIRHHLQSPARPFMKAKGVESVPSPVGNVSTYEEGSLSGRDNVDVKSQTDRFQAQVVQAFADMYSLDGRYIHNLLYQNPSSDHERSETGMAVGFVGQEALNIKEIAEGVEELKSPQWIYGQTPQFTLSSHAIEEDDRDRPESLPGLPSSTRIYIKARGAAITESKISLSHDDDTLAESSMIDSTLKGTDIYKTTDFGEILRDVAGKDEERQEQLLGVTDWLNQMFGKSA